MAKRFHPGARRHLNPHHTPEQERKLYAWLRLSEQDEPDVGALKETREAFWSSWFVPSDGIFKDLPLPDDLRNSDARLLATDRREAD